MGKLANICAEVGEIDKVAEGVLKEFTSGDRMHFDRKHLDPVEEYPSARLILATNNRPRFSDRSGGVWRRMIIIPFRVTIPTERQDRDLTKKLKGELPGIFNWAVEGLRRLRSQGRFTESRVCREALEEYRAESNPAALFLVESYESRPGSFEPCAEMYQRYRDWAQKSGYTALDAKAFGKEVRKAFPSVERVRRVTFGTRQYVYEGIGQTSDDLSDPTISTMHHILKLVNTDRDTQKNQ